MFKLILLLSCMLPLSSLALDDPMRPPTFSSTKSVKKVKSVSLILNGILNVDGNPLASINGVYLSEGEKIKGYRLMEIGREKVVLMRKNNRLILTLPVGNPVKLSGKKL